MELPKIPIYNATISEDDFSEGLFGISFVESGAVLQDFITMAEQHKPIIFKNEERHEVVGVLLIPNQLIYRNDANGEYYIRWGKEMIERAAVRMAQTLAYQNFTLDHSWFLGLSDEREYEQSTVSGVECLRLWVTEDKDDSLYTEYGFDVRKCPVGTLAIHVKVDNDELWRQCKDGTFNSFSIEGVVSYE